MFIDDNRWRSIVLIAFITLLFLTFYARLVKGSSSKTTFELMGKEEGNVWLRPYVASPMQFHIVKGNLDKIEAHHLTCVQKVEHRGKQDFIHLLCEPDIELELIGISLTD